MRIFYDPQADALCFVLTEGEVCSSRELAPGVIVDLDAEGHAVSVEFLQLRRRARSGRVPSIEIEFP